MSGFIEISTSDGPFQAYVAQPDNNRAAVIVVLHELFGINEDIKATCHEVAAHGFVALAPDLFWRQERGVSLSHFDKADWAKGMALYSAFDFDKSVADIAAAIAQARTMPGASGKVGVMGYCLGGLMTFLTAARTGADAAVAYYPGGAEKYVGEAGRIGSPFIVHLGTEDEYISKDAQAAIKVALAANRHARAYSYPGCSHAFARHGGEHFDADAAALANARTWDHFNTHLAKA